MFSKHLRNTHIAIVLPVILVLFLHFTANCQNQQLGKSTDKSVFEASLESNSAEIHKIKKAFKQLDVPSRPNRLNIFSDINWLYAKGASSERLDVTLHDLPGSLQPVTIRHRLLEPDSPMWYVTQIAFPRPVTLRINADDGAQAWYGGQRISVYRGRFFHFPASSSPKKLVIRVLNNAMHGGLNSVHAYNHQEFMHYERYRKLYRRVELFVEKAIQFEELSNTTVNTILLAINNPTEKTVASAEKALKHLPYFETPPYLQHVGPGKLSILWETDIPTSHQVIWGSDPELMNNTIESDSSYRMHEISLSNLEPGKTYYYQIKQHENRSRVYPFKLPRDTTHFEFAIWGDSQSGWETFDQVVHAMQAHPLEFTVGVGDLADQAWRPQEYTRLLQTLHPMSAHTPVYLVPGNHDYDGFYDSMIAKDFHKYARNGNEPPRTYYSWSSGNAAFIALDPHNTFPVGIEPNSDQYKWLVSELKKPFWTDAKWHFIVLHHPPYAQGWPGYHGEVSVREALEPLIEKYNIDFVVAGHSHAYERLIKQYGNQTTYYIVTGGAGGNITTKPELSDYPKMDTVLFTHHFTRWQVRADTILFQAIDNDRKVLDELTITK
ncbi:metallophosphoesterase [Halalkalibaculum sp. DA3122]|uniref:metallophosphoesterase n=1 Tax=Halalkalibaculum sp. DA3122 TaxID=3373607 RepID=UPI003754C49C